MLCSDTGWGYLPLNDHPSTLLTRATVSTNSILGESGKQQPLAHYQTRQESKIRLLFDKSVWLWIWWQHCSRRVPSLNTLLLKFEQVDSLRLFDSHWKRITSWILGKIDKSELCKRQQIHKNKPKWRSPHPKDKVKNYIISIQYIHSPSLRRNIAEVHSVN